MRLIDRDRRRTPVRLAVVLASIAAPGLALGGDPSPTSPAWTGTGSCAASACHGGRREPLGLKGSEYGFSESYDPHTRAYSVLFDERSLRIEKNYRRLANLDASRPFEDDACLKCHVHQGFDSKALGSRVDGSAVADGVSCEGCHGPAGNWLAPHVELGFQGLDERRKFELFGLRPTKDLLERGRACAECHVGLGEADVNHDLIAAGHPRLNFEYGSQLAKLPKHWRIGDDKARHPDYEARVWALGQLLAAQSALDLLASRAERSEEKDSTTPWPEFAEYSCFSCHHDLVKAGWPSANATSAPKPGSLQWGTWYLPIDPPSTLGPLAPPFADLRDEMTRPIPDPRLVSTRARSASAELGRMAENLNRGRLSPSEVRSRLGAIARVDESAGPLDWDRAARQYLGLVALDRTLAESDPGYNAAPVRAGLGRLLEDLDLPRQVDRRGGRLDSPYRFDPERIKGDLRSVQAALPQP